MFLSLLKVFAIRDASNAQELEDEGEEAKELGGSKLRVYLRFKRFAGFRLIVATVTNYISRNKTQLSLKIEWKIIFPLRL